MPHASRLFLICRSVLRAHDFARRYGRAVKISIYTLALPLVVGDMQLMQR